MDSLLILLPAAQETQLMPSCTTYRTQTNNASGSLSESHCHWMVWQWLSSIPVHTYIWFRSNQTKASLARLTDRLSLVKFIPPDPPLVQLYRNAAHRVIMIMSCAVEFYHVSPSPHSLSLGPNVQRVQMVWFQQARSCCTRVYSDCIDVDSRSVSQSGCRCRTLHQVWVFDIFWWEGARTYIIALYHTYSNPITKASVNQSL